MAGNYRLTLTGTPDATTDAVLPISSFNLSLNDGGLSYGSFSVPGGDQISDLITSRPNGELVLTLDEVTEVFRGNFDNFDFFIGSSSRSYRLATTKTTTNVSPVTYVIDSFISTGKNSYGERFYTLGKFYEVKAADSVTIDGATFAVRAVGLTVSAKTFTQTVTEQL